MATKFIKREKVIFTNPIFSKTVYPFVVNKRIRDGIDDPHITTYENTNFIDCGRLLRKVDINKNFVSSLIVQARVLMLSPMLIKYEAQLFGGTVSIPKKTEIKLLPIEYIGFETFNIDFPNTFDNVKILITLSAINLSTISSFSLANIIELAYIEKEDQK